MVNQNYVPAKTEGMLKLERIIRQARERRSAAQPVQRQTSLHDRVQEILARPGAVSSTGMINPRVVSREEARLIVEAKAPAALVEQMRSRRRVRTPVETTLKAVGTGLDVISETGLSAVQGLSSAGPSFPSPFPGGPSQESIERSRRTLGEIGQTAIGRRGIGETVTSLAERHRERPSVEQFVAGAVFDPLNLVPGVGFGTDIARAGGHILDSAARAGGHILGSARMEAGQQVARVPGGGDVGLRIAGRPQVAGAAEPDFLTVRGLEKQIANAQRAVRFAEGSGTPTRDLVDTLEFLRNSQREAIEGALGPERFERLQEAEHQLMEARARLQGLRESKLNVPRFGTPERAAFDTERRIASEQGSRIIPKAEQLREVGQEIRRLSDEIKGINEDARGVAGASQAGAGARPVSPVQAPTPNPPQAVGSQVSQAEFLWATYTQPPSRPVARTGAGGANPPGGRPGPRRGVVRKPASLGLWERNPPRPPRDPYDQLVSALEPERDPVLAKLRSWIPQQLYDRNFPLKALEKATGIPARMAAQVVPGAIAAGEDVVRRFYAPVLRTVGKDEKFLEQYLALTRMEDILARNPRAGLPGGIAGNAGRLQAMKTLEAMVGPERFATIQQAAQALWRLNDEHVLSQYVSEGIISPAQREAMLSSHPHYVPFQRADFTERLQQSLSAVPEADVSTTGIRSMTLEGSERALADPLQRLLQEPIKAQTVIFRNRAAKSIVRALEELLGKTGEDLVRHLGRMSKGEISQERDIISFFEDGVRHRVEVPAIYGRIAKGLESEPDNIALKIAKLINAPLRYGATTYNPFFLPVNVVRDAMSAMFREKLFPFGPDYWAGLWAAIRKNATFSEAAQSGALLSGVVENMRPGRALKNPLGGISVRNPVDAMLLPFRLVESANIVAERGVRIGAFRKLRAEGLDSLEAAVRSRDATVDFAKSGHAMRVINQIIPFSNAAVQGSANIARTIRDHKARSLAFGALFSVPVVMSRVNNMRFESSELIPDYEYTRNFVVQTGEGARRDGTKFPIYIKIPKGEIAAMFTFPTEAMFHLARKSEDRSAVELLLSGGLDTARNISPIELGGVTGLLPPAVETGVGLQTGVDPFTSFPIVPRGEQGLPPEQQFGHRTSTTAVELGKLFKVSPRLIDFALNDVAAGTGQSVNWLASMGLEALGVENTPLGAGAPDAEPQAEGVEALSQVPGVSRFLSTRDTQLSRRGYSDLDEAVVATNREFAKLPDVNRLGIRLGTVGNSVEGRSLTPQQRAQYQAIAGDLALKSVGTLVSSEGYSQLSDARRRSAIERAMSRAREEARREVLRTIALPENRSAPTTTPQSGSEVLRNMIEQAKQKRELAGVR